MVLSLFYDPGFRNDVMTFRVWSRFLIWILIGVSCCIYVLYLLLWTTVPVVGSLGVLRNNTSCQRENILLFLDIYIYICFFHCSSNIEHDTKYNQTCSFPGINAVLN